MMEENKVGERYVNIREGLNSKPRLVPISTRLEEIIKNSNKDYYRSLYTYDDSHKKRLEETGSLAGITDTLTNKLFFDFDDKENVANAKEDTIAAANKLLELGVNEEAIGVYFTGNKGFSIEVTIDEFITPAKFGAIIDHVAGNLKTLDPVVREANRIVRLSNTKHQSSGLYKIPLTPEELVTLSVDDIKKLAKKPRLTSVNETVVTLPEELKNVKVVEKRLDTIQNVQKDLTFDITSIDMKNRPKGLDEARWLLSNGFFRSGERNNAMLCLAATYSYLKYPMEVTRGILDGVADLQMLRTGEDKFPDNEVELILKQVYSDTWRGGIFTTRDPNNWLAKYAHKMGITVNEDSGPQTLDGIHASFKYFIDNIEKNTIKTGIEALDRTMPITIGSNIGVVAAAGAGKCLGKDTPILMFDGSIKMVQDVIKGDLVMGDDSTPRTVLGTTRGREKLYKVKQSYGDDYIVNASHILSVKTNQNKGIYQKGQVLDINVEEYIAKSKDFKRRFKGYKVPVDFGNKEVLVDPYYLGLWLGDGTSDSTTITNVDPEIKEFLASYASKLGMIYYERKNLNRTESLILVGKKGTGGIPKKSALTELMERYNLLNNKHIPKDYLMSSRETRLQLLAGLIDSDGHLSEECNFEIVQKNKQLSDQIVFLCRSLGFKAVITECLKSCKYKGEEKVGIYYRIYIKTNDYSIIPTKLPRKQTNFIPQNGVNYLSSMLEIEDIGEGDYYGFEVDGNHRFLLGDFTVTHNTALALKILKYNSEQGIPTIFCSLDMVKNRLFEKVLYNVTGMSREELYSAFKRGEGDKLTELVRKHYGNVWFYDRSSATISDIRSYILDVEQKTGQKVKMVMLDYFERINTDISDDTASSKRLANEIQDMVNDHDIACITLVQPNKFSLGGGPDTEIKSYTSIKGSSFLYQSFRGIISLSRPFYTPSTKEFDKYMIINVLKNDLGELDRLKFGWSGKRGDIYPLEDAEIEELDMLLKQKNSDKKEESGWE